MIISKKRKKRKRKGKPKPYRIYDLRTDTAVLHNFDVKVPASVLKAFGKSKFTRELQLDDPDRQRTRILKDILRVGCWCVDKDKNDRPIFWNVKGKTLSQISKTFRQHRDLGQPHNLCWGHGDPDTGIVDERDSIANIDDVVTVGDTLWISAYVNHEQAKELMIKPRPVSVRVVDNYSDGRGNVYEGNSLLHVAVVDHAVMDEQGPFMELSNYSRRHTMSLKKGKKSRNPFFDLALHGDDDEDLLDDLGSGEGGEETEDEDETDVSDESGESTAMDGEELAEAIEASPPGTTVVPLNEIVDKINRLLPEGIDLPTEGATAVTELTFNRDLDFVMTMAENTGEVPTSEEKAEQDNALRGDAEGQNEGGDLLSDVNTGDTVLDELPAQLANHPMVKALQTVLEPQTKAIKNLGNRMLSLEKNSGANTKQRYMRTLRKLADIGQIDAATVKSLQNLGSKYRWDLNLIKSHVPEDAVIDMSRQSRKIGNPDPKDLSNLPDDKKAERVKELAGMIP